MAERRATTLSAARRLRHPHAWPSHPRAIRRGRARPPCTQGWRDGQTRRPQGRGGERYLVDQERPPRAGVVRAPGVTVHTCRRGRRRRALPRIVSTSAAELLALSSPSRRRTLLVRAGRGSALGAWHYVRFGVLIGLGRVRAVRVTRLPRG